VFLPLLFRQSLSQENGVSIAALKAQQKQIGRHKSDTFPPVPNESFVFAHLLGSAATHSRWSSVVVCTRQAADVLTLQVTDLSQSSGCSCLVGLANASRICRPFASEMDSDKLEHQCDRRRTRAATRQRVSVSPMAAPQTVSLCSRAESVQGHTWRRRDARAERLSPKQSISPSLGTVAAMLDFTLGTQSVLKKIKQSCRLNFSPVFHSIKSL